MLFSQKNFPKIGLQKLISKTFFRTNHLKISYYEILDLKPNATQDEIKKSYYNQVKNWHPDLNPSPEAKEKFNSVKKAYDVLSNPTKKLMYDSEMLSTLDKDEYDVEVTSSRYIRKNTITDPSKFNFSENFFWKKLEEFYSIKESIKEDKFNRYRNNIYLETDITYQEALEGTKKKFTFFRWDKCPKCEGKRTEEKEKSTTCLLCKGNGYLDFNFVSYVHCFQCDGSGKIIEDFCGSCLASGIKKSIVEQELTIPPGVICDKGKKAILHYKGIGNYNIDMKCKSDVFLRVNIKQDTQKTQFKIKENDVHCEYYLTISQAILGGIFKVNTLEGVIEHKFPSGLKHDEYFIIKGKGLAKPNIRKGDLHLLIKIVYPDNDEAKGVIKKLYKNDVNNKI